MRDTIAPPSDKLDLRHPLLRKINEMTAQITGSSLLIVYPEDAGWKQAHGDLATQMHPAFCRMIQSSKEGAKHCRVCHIIMAVAACSDGTTEQRCHAGATVLVCAAAHAHEEAMAVLSSCLFSSEKAWADVRRRGQELGLNLVDLRQVFMALPRMDEKQTEALKVALQTMGYALQVMQQNRQLSAEINKLGHAPDSIATLEQFLANPAWVGPPQGGSPNPESDKPLLVQVVCELMQQRPDFPLTVKEVAAAARLTPNHFSTLFRAHAGKPFNEYLTDRRIERAKKLLHNPTLSVSEIARLTGYVDPGYFTRRFRDKTGYSPRAWRNRKNDTVPTYP